MSNLIQLVYSAMPDLTRVLHRGVFRKEGGGAPLGAVPPRMYKKGRKNLKRGDKREIFKIVTYFPNVGLFYGLGDGEGGGVRGKNPRIPFPPSQK